MIFSIVVIVLAGLVAYIWSTRGFFNALIHMLCTLIAGALAFAVWEPAAYFLLSAFGKNGFGLVMEAIAWGLGLAVPFAVFLAMLRAITDSILRANIIVNTMTNYIGGAVCGAIIGTISAGILVISISNLRISTEFMGYQPYRYDNAGNLVRKDKLIFPVDEITAGLYGALSERAFASGEPLARWHPDAAQEGAAMRISYGEGAARNTIRPNEVSLLTRFSVGASGVTLQDLLSDSWTTGAQNVVTVTGEKPDPNSRIEGFVLKFAAGAGEKSGKVILGSGQVRLLVADQADEKRDMLFPIAVSSQAEGDKPIIARWRYDSRDIFISSVGGGSESVFGFEFVVPNTMHPVALYVRGTRIDLGNKTADVPLTSAGLRDGLIRGGFMKPGEGREMTDIDLSAVVRVKKEGQTPISGIRTGDTIGYTLQLGTHSPLDVDEGEDSKTKNRVVGGEKTYGRQDWNNMVNGGMEKALRVERFIIEDDVQLVHLDVSGMDFAAAPCSLLGPVASQVDRALAPLLVDTNGTTYKAIGFIYLDDLQVDLRFTPDRTIEKLEDLKTLTRSRPDQQMKLIFRVSKGVAIKYFVIGNKAIVEFSPPVETR